MSNRWRARTQPPCWLNLEYLSAEPHAARSHGLPSPQGSGPGAGLTKWFFHPGFTPDTGGLLREPGLLSKRETVRTRRVAAGDGLAARAR